MSANGINDAGQIVGSYANTRSHISGFVDNAGTFSTISVPGAADTVATGINDAGQIAGYSVLPLPPPIPEPGTLLLLFIVMMAFAAATVGAQFRGWRTHATSRAFE